MKFIIFFTLTLTLIGCLLPENPNKAESISEIKKKPEFDPVREKIKLVIQYKFTDLCRKKIKLETLIIKRKQKLINFFTSGDPTLIVLNRDNLDYIYQEKAYARSGMQQSSQIDVKELSPDLIAVFDDVFTCNTLNRINATMRAYNIDIRTLEEFNSKRFFTEYEIVKNGGFHELNFYAID
ncbi:hypothetical protein [Leptospira meyeri]|uniref:hypothetical protein n=1 Tax=Leptospira meyeri TaxID=29508 RepID=UPI000C2B4D07|nr:hypothetical protein [Leptospira meyeri]PJZ95017.1 hypothetical protein CH358_19325 [Leptospira meyeri]